tara:strand:+ start:377 stop:1066 length:690 start_codon:yes stop_codon:yes gene_type:complete
MNTKISKYYNKKQAEEYETRRNKPIWKAETDFFKLLIKRISSESNGKLNLLDIPVGTGRWIPLVQKIATKYIGVDVSANMIDQAQQKLEGCSNEFKKSSRFINTSIEKLPLSLNGKFDLIIMTKFLPHFSINEIKTMMNILTNYLQGELIISLRVSGKKSNIFFEIIELITKSPIGAIKRYLKCGKLTYTKIENDYNRVFHKTGFKIISKNLVFSDKYSRYEYWVLKVK